MRRWRRAAPCEWAGSRNGHHVAVYIDDEGPGLANPSNLFVPFFTTKPQGSGIGLVLGRQIAEAHGGTLTLEPRPGAKGARATVSAAKSAWKTAFED